MTTFALVHGAWGSGWHWASVPGELRAMGHEVVAPDLPCEEPAATFDHYAAVVLDALGDAGEDVVVVGYSLGGHTAPLVASRRPVRELVFVGAMLPEPGLSLMDQLARGDAQLRRDYLAGIEGPGAEGISRWVDFEVYHRTSCHDCPEPVARERFRRSRGQAVGPFTRPCSLASLPDVPMRYLLYTEDRIVDNDFWRSAVPERLGIAPQEFPGSHSPMAADGPALARVLAGH